MSEYGELVKELRLHKDSLHYKAAQAIERLDLKSTNLEAHLNACRRGRIAAEQQLADARAEIEQLKRSVTAIHRVERMNTFKEVENWCDEQSQAMGAVDGYDYRSGEEYAYRSVAIHFGKAYRLMLNASDPEALAAPAPGKDSEGKE